LLLLPRKMTHMLFSYTILSYRRARTLLRKKKYQEKLLQNADAQLETLEKMASDIEFAQVELQVLDGLKNGNAALKKVHDILSIDEVEQIMDETREGIEKQQEIDSILTGALTDEDEDAVMAELEELVENEQREALAKLDNVVDEDENIATQLPDVPTDLPEKKKKVEGE
jgi:charged multivesicular body protein 6